MLQWWKNLNTEWNKIKAEEPVAARYIRAGVVSVLFTAAILFSAPATFGVIASAASWFFVGCLVGAVPAACVAVERYMSGKKQGQFTNAQGQSITGPHWVLRDLARTEEYIAKTRKTFNKHARNPQKAAELQKNLERAATLIQKKQRYIHVDGNSGQTYRLPA